MARSYEGIIIKGVGGLYTVRAADEIFLCKARGVFRKDKTTPFVGDLVKINVLDNDTAVIAEILPRKNKISRPPLANLDRLFIISSICDPEPNTYLIDRQTAIAENKGIEPIIIFSKADLGDVKPMKEIYKKAGFKVVEVSCALNIGIDKVHRLLYDKVSAFAGNSGVGKSTLLKAIYRHLDIKTGQVSKKLGRGRHTTRHVELYPVEGKGYVADTPGFSCLEMGKEDIILKDKLQYCFREFDKYLGKCKYISCTHTNDDGCAIKEAVELGEIASSRYQSYVLMYNEVKDVREWQLK